MSKKEKIVIYQTLVRLMGNSNLTCTPNGTIQENGCGKMSDINTYLLRSIKSLGCNYIWYTGLLQQASKSDYSAYGIPCQNPYVVKGAAGSPYAITDYYAISADLADDPSRRMEEFDELMERTHKVGLKVIMDFVPNHVAREYQSVMAPEGVRDFGADDDSNKDFARDNNYYYMPGQGFAPGINLGQGESQYQEFPARATGNDCFHPYPTVNDWYETVKLNYGIDYCHGGAYHFDPIPSTWQKMLHILLYWAGKGVDGFRCDMAHMVPVDFWHWAIEQVKLQYPAVIFIAEIYNPALYRPYIEYGGFDYLYDKVGLYDTLRSVIECKAPASDITRCWQSVEGFSDRMLNFLENHDEQRIASDFFAGCPEKALPALVVSALMRNNPFMLYFGQELGEAGMDQEGFSGCDGRTTIFDYWALPLMAKWQGSEHKWRKAVLPLQVRKLRDYYAKVLEVAQTEVVTDGAFYDLTYANYDNPHFDTNRQFAFFRCHTKEMLLVVANFDGEAKDVAVNIPQEAWKFAGMKNRRRHVTDLLTGKWDFYNIETEKPFEVKLPAYGAVVLRIPIR